MCVHRAARFRREPEPLHSTAQVCAPAQQLEADRAAKPPAMLNVPLRRVFRALWGLCAIGCLAALPTLVLDFKRNHYSVHYQVPIRQSHPDFYNVYINPVCC